MDLAAMLSATTENWGFMDYTLAVVALLAAIAAALALLIWRRKRPRLGRTIKRGTGRGYRPYRG